MILGGEKMAYPLLILFAVGETLADTRYFVKMKTTSNLDAPSRSNFQDKRMIRSDFDKKNSYGSDETSTFNPDVLNKFLEDYASKIKFVNTEKQDSDKSEGSTHQESALTLEMDDDLPKPSTLPYEHDIEPVAVNNNTFTSNFEFNATNKILNDTLKRNKYWSSTNSGDYHEDRNGWVTLDAIPWSKSKISKWQANTPSTTRPWPDSKPWDKYDTAKPGSSDYLLRPGYESGNNNKPPWYDMPKPNLSDNGSDKPWMKPNTRPSYSNDKYDQIPSQSQKWPPQRPSWDKYTENHSHGDMIITDDRPTNFPNNNWNRPTAHRPGSFGYNNKNDGEESGNDWYDYPHKYESNANKGRPNFSHYQYGNDQHPSTHPSNGDGQWVLLSTNRGYAKSRQRSIKVDGKYPEILATAKSNGSIDVNDIRKPGKEDPDPTIAVVTSHRQVRLTVLPSLNGTNTTTSHGGLLEVEKTFKSVDQSRKEYEMDKPTTNIADFSLKRRPIRNTIVKRPSNSAVLAAVGAGMLPATMAMMIPMMLGRRKRDLKPIDISWRKKLIPINLVE